MHSDTNSARSDDREMLVRRELGTLGKQTGGAQTASAAEACLTPLREGRQALREQIAASAWKRRCRHLNEGPHMSGRRREGVSPLTSPPSDPIRRIFGGTCTWFIVTSVAPEYGHTAKPGLSGKPFLQFHRTQCSFKDNSTRM